MMWPKSRILELFGIQLPIIHAPIAGCVFSEMVVAVLQAGGLGSLPCALLSLEEMRSELAAIRRQVSRPIHVNFFRRESMQIGKGSGDNVCSATTWSWCRIRTCPCRAPIGLLLTSVSACDI